VWNGLETSFSEKICLNKEDINRKIGSKGDFLA
jgi:hypothetical protein